MNLMEKNLLALKYEMALSCSVGKTFVSLVTQTYEGSIWEEADQLVCTLWLASQIGLYP